MNVFTVVALILLTEHARRFKRDLEGFLESGIPDQDAGRVEVDVEHAFRWSSEFTLVLIVIPADESSDDFRVLFESEEGFDPLEFFCVVSFQNDVEFFCGILFFGHCTTIYV